MFDDFSFDTRRSPSIDSNNTLSTSSTRSVSPCSPTTPFAVPRYSVTDLSVDFGRQRLRQDSQIYNQPCEAYANLDDDAGWSIDETPAQEAVRRAPSPARRRMQRQSNARLLCSASHHRDIAALLSRMVGEQEQCRVNTAATMTQSPVDMTEEACELAALSRTSTGSSTSRPRNDRRQSDLRKTGTSICKDTRLKKDKPRRHRSSDKQ